MTDLRAALHNLPQWAMVGPMNDRHMEAVRPGQYWSIADVLAALAASAPDEGPTAHLDLRSIREPCTACGASAPDEGPLTLTQAQVDAICAGYRPAVPGPYPTPDDFDAMTEEQFWAYCDRIGFTARIARAIAEPTE